MSLLERLHTERKARLARFEAAAYRLVAAVAKPVASPVVAPVKQPWITPQAPVLISLISVSVRIKVEVLRAYPSVTMSDMHSRRRNSTVVEARHVAMYLIKTMATSCSRTEYGASGSLSAALVAATKSGRSIGHHEDHRTRNLPRRLRGRLSR